MRTKSVDHLADDLLGGRLIPAGGQVSDQEKVTSSFGAGMRHATMAPSREELTMLRSWRPVFVCGRAALAHQFGARVLGAHVVIDRALSPTELLVTAERIAS